MPFANGATFAGYSILRRLGCDEMGDLYLAQHPRLPHWNALKVLSATLTEDREFRDRFMRETPIANGPYHLHIHPETMLFACLGPDGTPAKQTTTQVIWLQHAHGALRGTMTVTVEATNAASKARRSRSPPWPRALPRYLQESRCPGRRATLPPRRPRRRPPAD
jgi:hypothetical protein